LNYTQIKEEYIIAKIAIDKLKSKDYEHPLDRKALKALKNTPGIEKSVRKFHKYGIDKMLKVRFTGSNIKINENMFPDLYRLYNDSCERINLDIIPDLYIQQNPVINAFTSGVEEPIIVLNSGCIDLLTDDELLFILGHELGHVKSQHVLYHQMAIILPILGDVVGNATLGLGGLISTSLQVALLNWQRKSEFTADRAGLLNCQNEEAIITAMMKLAGVPKTHYDKLDPQSFIEQAKEFEGFDEENFDKFAKKLSVMFVDHPWTVMRASEINKWNESGRYETLLHKEEYTNFCSSCGHKLKPGDNFCTQCGLSI
jgi:Zn-dependent protease with chaperone function